MLSLRPGSNWLSTTRKYISYGQTPFLPIYLRSQRCHGEVGKLNEGQRAMHALTLFLEAPAASRCVGAVFLLVVLFVRLKVLHRVLLLLIRFLDRLGFQTRSTLFSCLPVSTKSNAGNAFRMDATGSHTNNSKLAKTSRVLACIRLAFGLIFQPLYHRITECSGLEGTSVGHLVQPSC